MRGENNILKPINVLFHLLAYFCVHNEKSKYLIDRESCVGCGQCANICPNGAIIPDFMQRVIRKVTIDREKCIGKGLDTILDGPCELTTNPQQHTSLHHTARRRWEVPICQKWTDKILLSRSRVGWAIKLWEPDAAPKVTEANLLIVPMRKKFQGGAESAAWGHLASERQACN